MSDPVIEREPWYDSSASGLAIFWTARGSLVCQDTVTEEYFAMPAGEVSGLVVGDKDMEPWSHSFACGRRVLVILKK